MLACICRRITIALVKSSPVRLQVCRDILSEISNIGGTGTTGLLGRTSWSLRTVFLACKLPDYLLQEASRVFTRPGRNPSTAMELLDDIALVVHSSGEGSLSDPVTSQDGYNLQLVLLIAAIGAPFWRCRCPQAAHQPHSLRSHRMVGYRCLHRRRLE